MVRLLNEGAARPGAMAVLVKNWVEARAIRNALSSRGVRSVYLSERDSVFATAQATDLWRILRAVANPRDAQCVRAALATALWGLPWSDLENLFQDELAWDALSERFHAWQKIWQHQGFLPMLHHLLHEQSIPARLLNPARRVPEHAGRAPADQPAAPGRLAATASLGLQGEGACCVTWKTSCATRKPAATRRNCAWKVMPIWCRSSPCTRPRGCNTRWCSCLLCPTTGRPTAARTMPLRLAEDIRLLYVALTRAEQAVWLGITPTRGDVDGK